MIFSDFQCIDMIFFFKLLSDFLIALSRSSWHLIGHSFPGSFSGPFSSCKSTDIFTTALQIGSSVPSL